MPQRWARTGLARYQTMTANKKAVTIRQTQNAGKIRRKRCQRKRPTWFRDALPAIKYPLRPKKPYTATVPSVVLLRIVSLPKLPIVMACEKTTANASTSRRKLRLLCRGRNELSTVARSAGVRAWAPAFLAFPTSRCPIAMKMVVSCSGSRLSTVQGIDISWDTSVPAMRDGPGVPPPATHQSVSETSARRFLYGSTVGITIAGAAFAWMVTGGTFQFLRSVPFSTFYDVQARSFLRGTWSMPASVLSIEGIRTGGRTDMYFGPVPALFRLPVLIFTHRLDGRLTEPSLLIGFVVALVFASLLSWRVRGMIRGAAPVSRFEAALTAAIIVVIGLGSVLFFLGATAQVYEEAEMWGAALALGSFYALVGFLNRPTAGRLGATGVLTTLALLTRGSVGAGPVAALGLAAAVYLFAWLATRVPRWQSTIQRLPRAFGIQVPDAPGRFGVGLVAAVAIPVVLYVAINEIKFGPLFSLPLNRQVLTLTNAHPRAVLAANGGSLFGLKFLPTTLLQFARPDALTPTRLFPWVFFPGKALVLGHLLYYSRDWTSSVPASMPVLFLLAVLGVISVFRPARLRGRFAPVRGRFAAPGSGIAPAGPEPVTIEEALAH